MKERRREKRSPIELAASFGIDGDSYQESEAKINNVSSGGFCFESEKRVFIGEEIHLAVELDNNDQVVIPVMVSWVSRNDKDYESYTVGVQIVEKESRDFERFMEFYNQQI